MPLPESGVVSVSDAARRAAAAELPMAESITTDAGRPRSHQQQAVTETTDS